MLDNLDISDSMSDEPETISSGGTSSGYGSNTGLLSLFRENFEAEKCYHCFKIYRCMKITLKKWIGWVWGVGTIMFAH